MAAKAASRAASESPGSRRSSGWLDPPIRRQTIADDELRSRMAERGAPERAASLVLGLCAASCDGEFATVDPTLAQLLGRPPTGMRKLIAQKVAAT